MVRMEKDGVKEFVFDCFIPYYRANGWKNEGESGEVQPLPEEPVANGIENEEVQSTTEEVQPLPEEPEQIFVCPHCGAKYEKQGSLKMHIKRKHPEQ
nr:MAG TPA: C2H2 type zinc-finger protein [Caudoviricetes sp.]